MELVEQPLVDRMQELLQVHHHVVVGHAHDPVQEVEVLALLQVDVLQREKPVGVLGLMEVLGRRVVVELGRQDQTVQEDTVARARQALGVGGKAAFQPRQVHERGHQRTCVDVCVLHQAGDECAEQRHASRWPLPWLGDRSHGRGGNRSGEMPKLKSKKRFQMCGRTEPRPDDRNTGRTNGTRQISGNQPLTGNKVVQALLSAVANRRPPTVTTSLAQYAAVDLHVQNFARLGQSASNATRGTNASLQRGTLRRMPSLLGS